MSQLSLTIDNSIPAWPLRSREAHKGDFGRVLLIGGSRGMSGAIGLSGMAALRAGAGLVTIATANRCLETVASLNPCYMTLALDDDAQGRIAEPQLASITSAINRSDVIAVGPGLGRSDLLTQMVKRLDQSLTQPLVIDADALFALSPMRDRKPAAGLRVMTPHAAEFERMTGQTYSNRLAMEQAAIDWARSQHAVVVLKGAGTLVTDGERAWRASVGHPGMASGGMGDVLTGMIAALLAQPLDSWQAIRLAVHWHGLSGDCAALRGSEPSLTALDVIDSLAETSRQLYGH